MQKENSEDRVRGERKTEIGNLCVKGERECVRGERKRKQGREMSEKGTVLVTGAGGFVASWLVKLLLSKGYKVRGTVRDPHDNKNAHLKELENASENLELVKANILDYDSVLAVVTGCIGVFHVASPLPAAAVKDPEVELMQPAINGTLNVLKASSAAGVKRVICVSSTGAIVLNPDWPKDKPKDESCWSNNEHCKATGGWYFLSKAEAERAAWKYAKESGLDVVTVCPAGVFGPLLQSTINASSLHLVSMVKGAMETMENEGWCLVDVRDVADALLLTYEKPEASGRYICGPHMIKVRDLMEMVKNIYPNYGYPKNYTDVDRDMNLTSAKLESLGWTYRPLEETLVDSVECFRKAGLLD